MPEQVQDRADGRQVQMNVAWPGTSPTMAISIASSGVLQAEESEQQLGRAVGGDGLVVGQVELLLVLGRSFQGSDGGPHGGLVEHALGRVGLSAASASTPPGAAELAFLHLATRGKNPPQVLAPWRGTSNSAENAPGQHNGQRHNRHDQEPEQLLPCLAVVLVLVLVVGEELGARLLSPTSLNSSRMTSYAWTTRACRLFLAALISLVTFRAALGWVLL